MSKRQYKKVKRQNGTYRYMTVLAGEKITDQSQKNMCDINLMMKQYANTGLLPQVKQKVGQFLDMTEIPDFMEAHKLVQEAKELFYQLPSEVRNLMNHDPANLEVFLADEKNKSILEKHGLIEINNMKKVNEVVENKEEKAKKAE